MTTRTKTEIHDIGVEFAAMKLIENGISTQSSDDRGTDLVLANGKTILVRAMSNESRLALTNGTTDYLKTDFLLIVSNLKYLTTRRIYIIDTETGKDIATDAPYVADNRSDFFINRSEYAKYRDNYDVLRD